MSVPIIPNAYGYKNNDYIAKVYGGPYSKRIHVDFVKVLKFIKYYHDLEWHAFDHTDGDIYEKFVDKDFHIYLISGGRSDIRERLEHAFKDVDQDDLDNYAIKFEEYKERYAEINGMMNGKVVKKMLLKVAIKFKDKFEYDKVWNILEKVENVGDLLLEGEGEEMKYIRSVFEYAKDIYGQGKIPESKDTDRERRRFFRKKLFASYYLFNKKYEEFKEFDRRRKLAEKELERMKVKKMARKPVAFEPAMTLIDLDEDLDEAEDVIDETMKKYVLEPDEKTVLDDLKKSIKRTKTEIDEVQDKEEKNLSDAQRGLQDVENLKEDTKVTLFAKTVVKPTTVNVKKKIEDAQDDIKKIEETVDLSPENETRAQRAKKLFWDVMNMFKTTKIEKEKVIEEGKKTVEKIEDKIEDIVEEEEEEGEEELLDIEKAEKNIIAESNGIKDKIRKEINKINKEPVSDMEKTDKINEVVEIAPTGIYAFIAGAWETFERKFIDDKDYERISNAILDGVNVILDTFTKSQKTEIKDNINDDLNFTDFLSEFKNVTLGRAGFVHSRIKEYEKDLEAPIKRTRFATASKAKRKYRRKKKRYKKYRKKRYRKKKYNYREKGRKTNTKRRIKIITDDDIATYKRARGNGYSISGKNMRILTDEQIREYASSKYGYPKRDDDTDEYDEHYDHDETTYKNALKDYASTGTVAYGDSSVMKLL